MTTIHWKVQKQCLTSLQPIAPHLSAANLRDYPLPAVRVLVESRSSYTHQTAAVDHSEDELVPIPSKQKEWSRQGCLPLTQTTRVEILCIKRGIMLQTRKSLITEVRGRTGVAHHWQKPPEWKSCAQTYTYKIWLIGRTNRYKVYPNQLNRLKRIEKLHHRKSQSIFTEAS